MEQTRIFTALGGVRGRKPVDVAELEKLLVRFSQLGRGAALDQGNRYQSAACVSREADRARRAHRAASAGDSRTGSSEAGDSPVSRAVCEAVGLQFHRGDDSPHSPGGRADDGRSSIHVIGAERLSALFPHDPADTRVAHERLTRICFIDYDREMVLVAERTNPENGEREIIGVGRLQGIGGEEAEYAIVISDDFHRQGLGTEFLRRLIEIGRIEGVKVIVADILADNTTMQKISEKLGFKLQRESGDSVVIGRLKL